MKIRDCEAKEYTLSECQRGIFTIPFLNSTHFHLFCIYNSCLHMLTMRVLITHIITQCFGFILLLLYMIFFFLAIVFRTELEIWRKQICLRCLTTSCRSTGQHKKHRVNANSPWHLRKRVYNFFRNKNEEKKTKGKIEFHKQLL